MVFDERITTGGIVLLNDNGKGTGIRPRWGQVYAVGPDQKDVKIGQWICVAHGRWTRGVKIDTGDGPITIRRIDHNDILAVSDEYVADENMGIPLTVEQQNGAPRY